jgi:hypothetical protein
LAKFGFASPPKGRSGSKRPRPRPRPWSIIPQPPAEEGATHRCTSSLINIDLCNNGVVNPRGEKKPKGMWARWTEALLTHLASQVRQKSKKRSLGQNAHVSAAGGWPTSGSGSGDAGGVSAGAFAPQATAWGQHFWYPKRWGDATCYRKGGGQQNVICDLGLFEFEYGSERMQWWIPRRGPSAIAPVVRILSKALNVLPMRDCVCVRVFFGGGGGGNTLFYGRATESRFGRDYCIGQL